MGLIALLTLLGSLAADATVEHVGIKVYMFATPDTPSGQLYEAQVIEQGEIYSSWSEVSASHAVGYALAEWALASRSPDGVRSRMRRAYAMNLLWEHPQVEPEVARRALGTRLSTFDLIHHPG